TLPRPKSHCVPPKKSQSDTRKLSFSPTRKDFVKSLVASPNKTRMIAPVIRIEKTPHPTSAPWMIHSRTRCHQREGTRVPLAICSSTFSAIEAVDIGLPKHFL